MITVLCGGIGAARFLQGLTAVVPPSEITAIVNTGDDFTLHGLRICPDIDTIRYTLTGDVGPQGWGRADETWNAMTALGELNAPAASRATPWFSLGDRDIATHLYRTQRLAEGATLTQVTAELTAAAGLSLSMLPMTDAPVATMVATKDGELLDFQEYFVGRRHQVPIAGVEFRGADTAKATDDVIKAIESAHRLVIAPSNPIVSIGPMLAMPRLDEAVRNRRADCTAISPIVGGAALKGPAADMMTELGHDRSAIGVAKLWSDYAATLLIDTADAGAVADIEAVGMQAVAIPTVMSNAEVAQALALAAIKP